MKNIARILLACFAFSYQLICALSSENFKVRLEPTWQNLENDTHTKDVFGGKWILVGSITFKKRAKISVALNQIHLQWYGEPLDNLMGSLYKHTHDKAFIPIEDNLICDSVWNKTKQMLILNFDEKQTLSAVNVFYLVLTIPEKMEPVLKQGYFSIEHSSLPEPFKEYATKNSLSLMLNKPTQYAQLLPRVIIQ
jgi:hypothetical protein